MSRQLPLYVEQTLGELITTRAYVTGRFEKSFREEHAVSCKAGCAHCCYYPIHVTIGEGLILYRGLAARGRMTAAVRARLEEHANQTSFMDPAVWMLSKIPCPLLDEKKLCIGYDARPLSCRLTFSAGDPDDCDPQAHDSSAMSDRRILAVVAAFEQKLLKKHGISTFKIPISRAVLLAEKIVAGSLPLNDVERILSKEYAGL